MDELLVCCYFELFSLTEEKNQFPPDSARRWKGKWGNVFHSISTNENILIFKSAAATMHSGSACKQAINSLKQVRGSWNKDAYLSRMFRIFILQFSVENQIAIVSCGGRQRRVNVPFDGGIIAIIARRKHMKGGFRTWEPPRDVSSF